MKRGPFVHLAVVSIVAIVSINPTLDAASEVQPATKSENSITLTQEKQRLAEVKLTEFRKWKQRALDKSLWRGDRGFALLRMAELGTNEAAEFLAEVWDNPLDVIDFEKLRIIDFVGMHRCTACIPILKKALNYRYTDERWHAAQYLAQLDGMNAIPLLSNVAERDPDELVRTQTRKFIAEALSRQKIITVDEAIVRAAILWGKSLESGPYIKGNVVYLLKGGHPSNLEDETLRLYSKSDLELLGKQWDGYTVWVIRVGDHTAWAMLKMAIDPPIDPTPFPYVGWILTLEKVGDSWSVREFEKNTRYWERLDEIKKINDSETPAR